MPEYIPCTLVYFTDFLSARFPFAVYYQIQDETVLIRAVLDLRRSPLWLTRKIRKL